MPRAHDVRIAAVKQARIKTNDAEWVRGVQGNRLCGTIGIVQVLLKHLVENPVEFILPAALLIVSVIGGFIVRRILFRIVRQWATRSESHLDVLIIDTLRGPIIIWALIFGVHVAIGNTRLPTQYQKEIHTALQFLWVLSFTIAATHFAGNAVRYYGARSGAQSVTSLTQKVAQLVVLALGIIWLFKVVFDMSLTPVITAFGVGGLAVALALQDTLSNLFAGFYVSISHLVRLGDYIKLSTGEEGYVTDINWRCTTIRTGSNNMTVIPNNKLGTTIYTNYNLPDGRMGLSISFGVASDTDIERMEAILLDEAKASAADIAGLMVDPPPSVFFTPGEWSLNFQLNFSVSQFGDQFPVQSQLRKRIYKRLLKESIRMPLPTKAVVVESKSASA
ncbi:MAG TPA: mechanosensitive ion channel family protein [Bryobacteraceae bacterium]|nr:mechanosensitive ion channel family protein [Bryobacteraceae bacterium]